MSLFGESVGLLRYVLTHPIGRRQPVRSVARVLAWQMRSRLRGGPFVHRWIGGSSLVVRRGMSGATGNVYLGLYEFADMAFALHLLKENDLFHDIGANVGTYTVLAAKVRGARVLAFEPDAGTAGRLADNLRANAIEGRVEVHQMALGEADGEIAFTIGLDAVNRVAAAGEPQHAVPVRRLDAIAAGDSPVLIKIDVEGHETAVLRGAVATLADPGLLAIEIETVDGEALDMLSGNGFTRHYYDPFTRMLGTVSGPYAAHNSLFVRDAEAVRARVASAPAFAVFGIRI